MDVELTANHKSCLLIGKFLPPYACKLRLVYLILRRLEDCPRRPPWTNSIRLEQREVNTVSVRIRTCCTRPVNNPRPWVIAITVLSNNWIHHLWTTSTTRRFLPSYERFFGDVTNLRNVSTFQFEMRFKCFDLRTILWSSILYGGGPPKRGDR